MTLSDANSWTTIRDELRRRIHERVWQPGDQIPHEADLAAEFGCARTTMNRALRDLAASGLVLRKRKAGTRVAVNPPQRATLTIPIIREEVEARGAAYRHSLLSSEILSTRTLLTGPVPVALGRRTLRISTLHFADDRPFIVEDRHIDLGTVPDAEHQRFDTVSANEWLVHNSPYSHGDIAFFALAADADLARHLDTEPGAALFAMERVTWTGDRPITHVRLTYMPGYLMRSEL